MIHNCYGQLEAIEHKGRFYWIIGNYDTNFKNLEEWEEIDEPLYRALQAFDERQKARRIAKKQNTQNGQVP